MKKVKLLGLALILCSQAFTQSNNDKHNPIITAVQLLDIPTNARIGAFGEIASVSSPFYPGAGLYQNPALLSRQAQYAGGNMSFNPWLIKLTDGIYRGELSGFYAINNANAVAYNFTIFNYNEYELTDELGNSLGVFQRTDYFHQITYAHSFANGISIGGGLKYIRSSLGIDLINGVRVKPANSVAIDLGFDYAKGFRMSKIFLLNLDVGMAINNFGSKINYVGKSVDDGDFLPTYLRLGILLNPEINLSDDFVLGFDLAYQAEKLLVPTPPVYKKDANGSPIPIPGTDKYEIEKGMDPDISIFRALYQSFYDAPDGWEEEMYEIVHKLGGELRVEYRRKAYLAGRVGKFIEHPTKGGRNYLTWGAGVGAFGFALDFKKLKADNPFLDGSWALTLGFRTSLSKSLFRF